MVNKLIALNQTMTGSLVIECLRVYLIYRGNVLLGPPVVGMCPCRIYRDIEHITMTDGLRTLTFAFSEIQNPSPRSTLLQQLELSMETNILDNFKITTIQTS